MTHPDLRPEDQEWLHATYGTEPRPGGDAAAPPPASVSPESTRPSTRTTLRARVKRAVAPALDPALARVAAAVEARLHERVLGETHALAAEVQVLRAQLAAVAPVLALLEGSRSRLADLERAADAARSYAAVEINLELLKGELRSFQSALDRLGDAIAPGAGLVAVPARFAELRERVNAVDRRVGQIDRAAALRAAGASPDAPAPTPVGHPFDYVGFEQRFRGDGKEVLAVLEERYLSLLAEHQPVLDFGCGRGELLAALAASGVEAVGVDTDAGMVEQAQAAGLPAQAGDGIAWLRDAPERSLGSIIAIHVVEHLPLPLLVEFLELAASRLRPGGVLVAETPNPMSLVVLGNSYILDPTHVWPLHPSLLTFLCERAGFRDVELRFYAPAEEYHLLPVEEGEAPGLAAEINDRIRRLNGVLFGPQEYAALATAPPA